MSDATRLLVIQRRSWTSWRRASAFNCHERHVGKTTALAHIRGPAAVWEGDAELGLTLVGHLLISDGTGAGAVLVPTGWEANHRDDAEIAAAGMTTQSSEVERPFPGWGNRRRGVDNLAASSSGRGPGCGNANEMSHTTPSGRKSISTLP